MRAPEPLPVRFELSAHARMRMVEMGVRDYEVFEALMRPEVAYQQSTYGPGRFMFQAGRLAVPVKVRPGAPALVATVLWRQVDEWDRKEEATA